MPTQSPAPARRETILTGDRPTGALHLGHYAGSLRSRVELQHAHDQTILVADLQALTDNAGRATDVRAIDALADDRDQPLPRIVPMRKRLVLDFTTLGLSYLDNIEGMSWGPTLPNGHRTLVFVSDDNFNILQTSQFLAFEAIGGAVRQAVAVHERILHQPLLDDLETGEPFGVHGADEFYQRHEQAGGIDGAAAAPRGV